MSLRSGKIKGRGVKAGGKVKEMEKRKTVAKSGSVCKNPFAVLGRELADVTVTTTDMAKFGDDEELEMETKVSDEDAGIKVAPLSYGNDTAKVGVDDLMNTLDLNKDGKDGEHTLLPWQIQMLVDQQVQLALLKDRSDFQRKREETSRDTKMVGLPALEKLRNFKGETDTDELDIWLKELKRHCQYYAVSGALNTDEKQLAYAISHLTGGAEAWWETQRDVVRTMAGFLEALNSRFRSVVDADKAAEELYDIKQKEGQSVASYSDHFMRLLVRVPKMQEDDRIRLYRRGLLYRSKL